MKLEPVSTCICGTEPDKIKKKFGSKTYYSVKCKNCGLSSGMRFQDEWLAIDVWNDTVNSTNKDINFWSNHVGSDDRDEENS